MNIQLLQSFSYLFRNSIMNYLYQILDALARKRQIIKASGNKEELRRIDTQINKVVAMANL